MRLARSVPTRNVRAQRPSALAATVAKKSMPSMPRRSSVSMPPSLNKLQEINDKLYKYKMKRILASGRAKAWRATELVLIPSLLIPTIGAGLSGATILMATAALLDKPTQCLPVLFFAGGMFAASLGACEGQMRLISYAAKKSSDNAKSAIEVANQIEELQKQRKTLSDRSF
ncbi:hypothetical protein BH09DEP1_BH09DEP1_1780 [soil metagenome]